MDIKKNNNYNLVRDTLCDLMTKTDTFVMLMGCPASGKSTFAKEVKNINPDVVIINPDDIREELLGDRYDQSNNYEVFSKVYERIDENIQNNKSIIYDATNTVSKFREKAINATRKKNVTIVGIIFDTTIKGCFDRNLRKEVPVFCSVIERMYINLKTKKPSINEGFDILMTIHMDD